MEVMEFVEKAKEAGMSDEKIAECILHNDESLKLGYSSFEVDLMIFKNIYID